jgi:hypothetical protein
VSAGANDCTVGVNDRSCWTCLAKMTRIVSIASMQPFFAYASRRGRPFNRNTENRAATLDLRCSQYPLDQLLGLFLSLSILGVVSAESSQGLPANLEHDTEACKKARSLRSQSSPSQSCPEHAFSELHDAGNACQISTNCILNVLALLAILS